MKKTVSLFCLLMILAGLLAGCGTAPEKEETPAPESAPAPAESAAPPIQAPAPAEEAPAASALPEAAPEEALPPDTVSVPAAGSYTWTDGESGVLWTVSLRENGTFTLREDRPDGTSALHTGEGWSPEADGTVTCGPTDVWQLWFSLNGGCSTWTIFSDGTCEPLLPEA